MDFLDFLREQGEMGFLSDLEEIDFVRIPCDINVQEAVARALEQEYELCAPNDQTVTKLTLNAALCQAIGISRLEANQLIEETFAQISQALVERHDVKLANFGSFTTRDKVSRPGRNPRTGEAHEVQARCVVTFMPSPHMRGAVTELTESMQKHPELLAAAAGEDAPAAKPTKTRRARRAAAD